MVGKVDELSGKEINGEVENYWFINKMVTDFVGNSFVRNLYHVWGKVGEIMG